MQLQLPVPLMFLSCMKLFAVLAMMQCLSVNASNDIHEITLDGHKISYRTTPSSDVRGTWIYNQGVISVTRIYDKSVRYEIHTDISPGCDSLPAISIASILVSHVEKQIAVICGGISGRHQTIMMLWMGANGLNVSSLDFFDSSPNFSIHDGVGISFTVQKSRATNSQPSIYIPYAYEFKVTPSTGGFYLSFNKSVQLFYSDYLDHLLMANILSDSQLGSALAALYAIGDKVETCSTLTRIMEKGVTKDRVLFWSGYLTSLEYPNFDLNKCN